MDITYDPIKNELNIAKHSVSLELATQIEWDALLAKQDNRQHYGEVRMIGYALIRDRVYVVVFTDRGNERRIISLRKANLREVRFYANNH